jgi:hypothetical protein
MSDTFAMSRRDFRVMLASLAAGSAILTAATAPVGTPLPACPTEDSTGCLWDGRTAGQWHHLAGTLPGQDHRQD